MKMYLFRVMWHRHIDLIISLKHTNYGFYGKLINNISEEKIPNNSSQ